MTGVALWSMVHSGRMTPVRSLSSCAKLEPRRNPRSNRAIRVRNAHVTRSCREDSNTTQPNEASRLRASHVIEAYNQLVDSGCTPQEALQVLETPDLTYQTLQSIGIDPRDRRVTEIPTAHRSKAEAVEFKRIYVWDGETEETKTYVFNTKDQFQKFISKRDLVHASPEGELRVVANWEDVEDGVTYTVDNDSSWKPPVKELSGWRDNTCKGQEDTCGECALRRMNELGHATATRFCHRKVSDGKMKIEIDGAAVDPEGQCALLVEMKTTLTCQAAYQLRYKIKMLEDIANKTTGPAAVFKGKQVMGALCCIALTSNTSDRNLLKELCREWKFEVWFLHQGENGFSVGSSCFPSPYIHG